MTDPTPRLLPWSSHDGKPCYLAGDGTGYVSRAADRIEAEQLGAAVELIEEARAVLAGRRWTPGEIHLLAVNLAAALADVHRVAESRGARLVVPDYEGAPGDEDDEGNNGEGDRGGHDCHDGRQGDGRGPQLPAEAFG
ncbi:hypothetical protein ACFCVY_03935 [Streptomyces sp. NPDC056411]|uniref:hypothetical protein n=1 Tax=Streptomyces sp. NPDC056411 TaxID=3345813 RepID=UPI0035E12D61